MLIDETREEQLIFLNPSIMSVRMCFDLATWNLIQTCSKTPFNDYDDKMLDINKVVTFPVFSIHHLRLLQCFGFLLS